MLHGRTYITWRKGSQFLKAVISGKEQLVGLQKDSRHRSMTDLINSKWKLFNFHGSNFMVAAAEVFSCGIQILAAADHLCVQSLVPFLPHV